MDAFYSSLLGSLPMGIVIIVIIVVTYIRVKDCMKRIERLEGLFLRPPKNPGQKGGDK